MNQRDLDVQGQAGFCISHATAEDVPGCHAVDASFDLGFETNDAVFRRAIAQQQLLVCKEGTGQVVGYLRWGYFWDDEVPYIQMIRIIESYRRQGIGRRLVLQVHARVKEQGAHYLLSSTDESNIDSMDFHERLGFEECGVLELPGDLREFLLVKRL
jgi:ribosomal protein S18 acetylase RimI-like enzyme